MKSSFNFFNSYISKILTLSSWSSEEFKKAHLSFDSLFKFYIFCK